MIARIRQLLAWQQLSPTQFADLIGVGRPVISHILSERNKPSLDVVQRIVAALPAVSLPWLLSGVGDMLASSQAPGMAIATEPVVLAVAPPAPLAPEATRFVIASEKAEKSAASAVAAPTAPKQPALVAVPRAAPPAARFVAGRQSASLNQPSLVEKPVEQGIGVVPFENAPPPAKMPAESEMLASPAAAMPLVALPPSPAPPAETQPARTLPPIPAAAASSALRAADEAAALATLLAEPEKAIRRIVIFYRDGSFADYVPEG